MKKVINIFILLLFHVALWGQTNQIKSYEYWFNDNYSGKVAEAVSPTEVLNLSTSFPTTGLRDGLHTLNIRFKDQNNQWSSTQNQYFLKTSGMAAYEYWFNDDYQNKIIGTLSGQQDVTLNLNVANTGLKPGMHTFNIRTKSQAGSWSVTQSEYFLKASGLAAYEYWFNNDYTNKVTGSLSGQGEAIINLQVPTQGLKAGMHTFHFRTRNAIGSWSSTQSQFFWKTGAVLTKYEYWYDDKYDSKVTGNMAGQPVEDWNKLIALPTNLSFDVLYARFQDTAGAWSSTLALPTPAPKSDFYMLQDRYFVTFNSTSKLAKTHKWSFGDGSQSTQVNPSRTYTQPGEYFVKLVVNNISGSDSITQQLTIHGISSVVPDKAGNAGLATITVNGGGLTAATTVKLSRSGFPDIQADTSYLVSPGKLNARFNLAGEAIGLYDVVVSVPQFPPLVAENAFTIEAGKPNEFWAEVSGREVVLVNRWQTYTVNYGNLGNNDIYVAPLWLLISDVAGLEIEFLSRKIELPLQTDATWLAIRDSVQPWFPIDSLGDVPFKARVYPLFIPLVQANETGSFTFRVKSPQNYRIVSWVNPDWYTDPRSGNYNSCIRWAQLTALANGLVTLIGSQIPGVDCVGAISLTLMNYDHAEATLGSVVYSLTRAAIECVWDIGGNIPIIKAWKLTKEIMTLAANIYDNYDAIEACKKKFPPDKLKDKPVAAVNSFDPNEIVGPGGYTTMNYNFDNIAYPYLIYFENLNTATAPAQEVFVYDTLGLTKYDISTFYFGNIGFGPNIVYVEPGLKQFTKDLDLRPAKNIILRINARLDTQTGVAQWSFASLDPVTMGLTEDPFGGFLPPNVTSPEGEGYVSFTVRLKANLPHASVISNKATIVFDLNAPIRTNIWVNAIDRVPPTSTVSPLPAQTTHTTFMVNWNGTDQHSGVKSYSIYVSKNGAAPEVWKLNTQQKSSLFDGITGGNTYRFYSLATDSIGNQEVFNGTYHTTITILATSADDKQGMVDYFKVYPNPARDQLTVDLQVSRPAEVRLVILDVLGRQLLHQRIDAQAGDVGQFLIDISKFDKGAYFCVLETPEGRVARKIMIQR